MKTLYTLTLLFCFACFSFTIHAQPVVLNWAALQGGEDYDLGSAIAVDEQGNVYTAGEFNETVDMDPGPGTFTLTAVSSQEDAFVCKFDSTGQLVWAKQLEGDNSISVIAMALDASGNVYTTGFFRETVDFDPGAGVSNVTSEGYDDVFLLKLDTDGNFGWVKTFGGEQSSERIQGIAIDATGNIFAGGRFIDSLDIDPGPAIEMLYAVDDKDGFVAKFDAQGNLIWGERFGSEQEDDLQSVALDNDGNVYATGFFRDTTNFDPDTSVNGKLISNGLEDIYIVKFDNDGAFVWVKGIGGIYGEQGMDIDVDADGNVISCGRFNDDVDFDPGAGVALEQGVQGDAYFLKLTPNGDFIWVKTIGGNDSDAAAALAVDGNDLVFTGHFSGNIDIDPGPMPQTQWLDEQGAYDMFVLKLDEDGNMIWGGNVGSNSGFHIPNGIAAHQGSAYVIGGMAGTPIDGDPGSPVFELTPYGESDIFTMRVSDGVTSIGSHQGVSNISVYPNPFTDNFIVNISKASSNANIRITDAIGKLVYESFDVRQGFTYVSFDKQPAGVYFLLLRFGNENAVVRIVKK